MTILRFFFYMLALSLGFSVSCANAAYQQSGSSLIVLEGEHYTGRRTSFDGYRWEQLSWSGAVSAAVEIDSRASVAYPVDYETNGSRLDFAVNFDQTGTYYVWVRMFAKDARSDTLHLGLDGVAVSTGTKLRATTVGDWVWSRTRLLEPDDATVQINTLGQHTLNVYMREAGMIVDRLLLTSDPAFVPTGTGPAESVRSEDPAEVVAMPVISPPGGTHEDSVTVSLSTATTGATIYYTLDGGTPSADDNLYNGPFDLTTSAVVKARAVMPGATDSATAQASFTINTSSGGGGEPGTGAFLPDASGRVIMEAEHFHQSRAAFDGYQWEQIVSPGAVSNAMEIGDGASTNYPVDYQTNGARLDFEVRFDQPGTYYVWARMYAKNGLSDTLHIGLDGIAVSTGTKLRATARGEWVWSRTRLMESEPATVQIGSTGVHTLNLFMRESGMVVDRLLLTSDPAFTPVGDGPNESGQDAGTTPPAIVATPTISPNGGTHSGSVAVSLGTTTAGATIYYTVDGSMPDSSDNLYGGPFVLTSSATVKARAVKVGSTQSAVAEASFVLNTTGGSGGSGAYLPDSSGRVVVDAEGYSGIRAAFDGASWQAIDQVGAVAQAMEIPDEASTAYPNNYEADGARMDFAINFAQGGTYYVWARMYAKNGLSDTLHIGLDGIAVATGTKLRATTRGAWVWSKTRLNEGDPASVSVGSAGVHILNVYMRESGMVVDRLLLTQDPAFVPSGTGPAASLRDTGASTVSSPTISPNGGTFSDSVLVTLASPTSGANIYYTLDGSTPATSSLLYSSPVLLTATTTVRAMAVKSGMNDSGVVSATFTRSNGTPSSSTYLQAAYADGKVVMEGELNVASSQSGLSHGWTPVSNGEASAGTYLAALPDNGTVVTSNITSNAPRLDFPIEFNQSGTYYLWVRGIAPDSGADLLHAGLDGSVQSNAKGITGFTTYGVLRWSNSSDTGRARISVTSAGLHTVNVWMGKDGFGLDKLVLTKDPDFVPALNGPAISARGSVSNYPVVVDGHLSVWELNDSVQTGGSLATAGSLHLSCSTCPQAVSGLQGGAAAFTGTETLVRASDMELDFAANASFTAEAIVRISGSCDGVEGFLGRFGSSSTMRWGLGCQDGRLLGQLRDSAGKAGAELRSAGRMDDGRWHHLALVRDGEFGETSLYLDGMLADRVQETFAGGFQSAGANFELGKARFSGGLAGFAGDIDAAAVYARPLRGDELARHALSTSRGLLSGLYACGGPIQVMPLGDSITAGSNGNGSALYGTYRKTLHSLLQATGFNVDFVGGKTSYHSDDPDLNHEGWPGFNADQIRGRIKDIMNMNPPVLGLLHIGTNGVETGAAKTSNLLDWLRANHPKVPFVVATIINRKTSDPVTIGYNDFLRGNVTDRVAAGERRFLVEMQDILNPATDYLDNLHPNAEGAEKMAVVWFEELKSILPRCRPTAATLEASSGVLNAQTGQAYRYTPEVLGHPIGTFSRVSGPSGLQVNSHTGEWRWTNPTAGNHSVKVRVENAYGVGTRTYNLVVD